MKSTKRLRTPLNSKKSTITVSFKNPREEEKIGNVNYSDPRVLMGNWLQCRHKFHRHMTKKESSYSADYKPIRIDYDIIDDNAEFIANKVVESQGVPVGEDLNDDNFACNFLTLYDIYYNNVWTKLNNKDYTQNEINGVNRGLIETKMSEWKYDKNGSEPYLTTAKRDFIEHKVTRYPRRRQQAEAADKLSVCRMFVDAIDFETREERICYCPMHPEICAIKPRNPGNILP